MTQTDHCSVSGCMLPPATTLALRAYCIDHFISACREGLVRAENWIENRRYRDKTPDAPAPFLGECIRLATRLAAEDAHLTSVQRVGLVEILVAAAGLNRHMRRSPRKLVSIKVRVGPEKPDENWSEETETKVLSRYGAMLECHFPAEVGQRITVERKDCGRKTKARVVWCQQNSAGNLDIGIEFVDTANFWDFET